MCEIKGCSKPINRDNLCLRHKLLKVNVATVPGGSRDRQNGISKGRNREKGLHRYRELKAAGEQPSGTTLEAQRKDSYKKHLWEKHEQNLVNENPPEKVTEIKKSLVNKE